MTSSQPDPTLPIKMTSSTVKCRRTLINICLAAMQSYEYLVTTIVPTHVDGGTA